MQTPRNYQSGTSGGNPDIVGHCTVCNRPIHHGQTYYYCRACGRGPLCNNHFYGDSGCAFCKAKKGFPGWATALIVIAVLAIGAAVAFFSVYSSRIHSPSSPATSQPQTTPPAAPEYHALTFDLFVPEGQQPYHDDYSFPIYIRDDQTLHLTFTVEQGDDIWFGFSTPSGKYIGVNQYDGGFGFVEGICARLKGGMVVFKPSEHGWGEGYYSMNPHLSIPGKVRVEVEYWLED